jgi:hypothetical protein
LLALLLFWSVEREAEPGDGATIGFTGFFAPPDGEGSREK